MSDDGPILPDQTSDDTDAGWGEDSDDDDDERFVTDLPPHHVDRD